MRFDMSLEKAVTLGVTGNELSKKIVGSKSVSATRTVVSTSLGGLLGSGTAVAAVSIGVVGAAPAVIPFAVASASVAFVASLFD